MNEKTYLFIYLITFISCLFMEQGYAMTPREIASNEVTSKISKTIQEKYGLKQNGTGGAIRKSGIWLFSLSFEKRGSLTKDQSRCLIVNMIEDAIEIINKDKSVREYLENFPIKTGNLSFSIHLVDEKGNDLFFPDLSIVANRSNIRWTIEKPKEEDNTSRIFYGTNSKDNQFQYFTKEYEPYENAKRIAIEQGCFKNSASK